jgi:hypothetical protein
LSFFYHGRDSITLTYLDSILHATVVVNVTVGVYV